MDLSLVPSHSYQPGCRIHTSVRWKDERGSVFAVSRHSVFLPFEARHWDGPNCDCAANHDNVVIYLKITVIVGSSFLTRQSAASWTRWLNGVFVPLLKKIRPERKNGSKQSRYLLLAIVVVYFLIDVDLTQWLPGNNKGVCMCSLFNCWLHALTDLCGCASVWPLGEKWPKTSRLHTFRTRWRTHTAGKFHSSCLFLTFVHYFLTERMFCVLV